MAHLRARAERGGGPAILFFGERHPAQDDFHAPDRAALTATGVLTRTIAAWSRWGQGPRYVQDAVADHADLIRDAVAAGAAILVCGSVTGMAPGVHAALAAILAMRRWRRCWPMAATGATSTDPMIL